MNVPSYVKSNRVAITSLLAMARSTVLIKQVCGAHGVIVIIYYHYCVVFVSAIIALCVYVFLCVCVCVCVCVFDFIFEHVVHLTSLWIHDDRPLFLGKDYKRVQK